MLTVEGEPRAVESAPLPERGERWTYHLEQATGELEHDEILKERAAEVAGKIEKPLPRQLVEDLDQYISGEVVNNPRGKVLDEEVANVQKDEKSMASFGTMMDDLQGVNELRQARSLQEVWEDVKQLQREDKKKRLRDVRVLSLALGEALPDHEKVEDWEGLSEEQKQLIRVAEIMKLRSDIEIAENVINKGYEVADETKFKNTKELEEVVRDYAQGDDIPINIKEEFIEAVERLRKWPDERVNETLGERDEEKPTSRQGGVKETEGSVDVLGDALEKDQTESETIVQSASETVVGKSVDWGEDKVAAADLSEKQTQTEQAGKKLTAEYVNRPIFGKEAIKSKDIKAIQEQLKGLTEKDDARSAFDLARQLAYLKRAGIKLSDRGKEYYAQSLDKHGEAMREQGARAVAQYHTYLKYLGMEQDLAAEDKAIIRESCEAGGLGNRRHLASLAVNAKYLGVLDDVEFIKDDLEADFRGQLEEHVPADNIALEMARRKYLQVPYKLPEKYEEVQELVDSRLERCVKDGLWDKYVRLKGHVDYVQGGGTVEEENKEKIAGYVEEMAKRARKDGIWQEYSAYIGDAAHLSRHNGKYGQANETKENQTEAESIVVGSWINLESEEGQREAEGGEAKKEDGIPDTGMAKETERDEAGNKRVIDPEQYPNRAQFEEKAKKFNEAQENNPKAWGSVQDILHRERLELKQRENYLLKKRQEQEREGSVEAQWANEAMDRLREGADFSEVVNEDYLMEHLLRHKVSAPEREERRGRYLGIMRNELGLAQMIDEPTMMDRVSSIWMERWYARWQVAKGVNKLKAVWPWGKAKRREVVRARQDMISTIEEAAVDEKVDGRVRALLQRLATEFELMNVRDAGPLAGKKHVSEQKKKKNKTKGAAQPQRGKGRESAAEKEKEASYGGRG